jgi:rSAM/selenodomain-associated transferase 1
MNVLGIFAKEPTPGLVKTRLAAESSPAFAADVAHAFLHDALDRWADYPARRWLAFAPASATPYFTAASGGRFEVTPQGEGDLGQRMARFFADRINSGAERTVLIGTDSPTLPTAHVEQAFLALADHDVVLGPAADGGYYLIGLARRLPTIFDGIAWGSATVLTETVARLGDWRCTQLPTWYDVDTLADWRQLSAEVKAGVQVRLPRTSQLVYSGCSSSS